MNKNFNHQTWLGVGIIVITMFCMALADAVVKFASPNLTLWQIFTIRSLLVLAILIVIHFMASHHHIQGKDGRFWVMMRSIFLSMMYICIYAGIPIVDLSTIAVSLYTAPIFIVLFTAMFLNEPVGKTRWIAVFIGFLGVIIALQPNKDGFSYAALIPIAGAVFYALSAIITRKYCHDHSTVSLAIYLNVVLLLTGVIASLGLHYYDDMALTEFYPFLFGAWENMALKEWWIITLLTALMLLISLGFAKAYQIAPPPVLASFDYSYLIFALLLGLFLFQETLYANKLIGMAFIIAGGIFAISTKPSSQAKTE